MGMGTGTNCLGLVGYSSRSAAQRTFLRTRTALIHGPNMTTSDYLLDHERLEVYQLSREHAREAQRLLKLVGRGRSDLADQYRRASLSIPLNIAEGAGEYAPAEKARFYRMARRSATECAAVIDHMADLELLPDHETRAAKALLRRIVSALVRLILATEKMAVTTAVAPAHSHAHARKRAPAPDLRPCP